MRNFKDHVKGCVIFQFVLCNDLNILKTIHEDSFKERESNVNTIFSCFRMRQFIFQIIKEAVLKVRVDFDPMDIVFDICILHHYLGLIVKVINL